MSSTDRPALEARANSLGVPWSHATTDDDLTKLIAHVEAGRSLSDFNSIECHGVLWDPSYVDPTGKGEDCSGCGHMLSGSCVAALKANIVRAQGAHGEDIAAIAEELDTSVEIVTKALAHGNGAAGTQDPAPKATVEVGAGVDPDSVTAEVSKSGKVEDLAKADLVLVDAPKVEEPEDGGPLNAALGAVEDPPEVKLSLETLEKPALATYQLPGGKPVVAPKAPEPAKPPGPPETPVVAAPVEAPPPPVKAAEAPKEAASVGPTVAGSAKSAAAPAKSAKRGKKTTTKKASRKTGRKKPADPVAEPEGRKPRVNAPEWGPHTFATRFARERAKSLLISGLVPGTTVSRTWQGETITVVVHADHYSYRGQKFPTLYSVTKHITGTIAYENKGTSDTRQKRNLCQWSAARFWKLKRAAAKLQTQPKQVSS